MSRCKHNLSPEKCGPCYQARWHQKQKTYLRDFGLRKRYGISLADYDRMLNEQGGRCKICLSSEPGGKGRMHVDHDHKTGKVRGLLCNFCNSALGYLRDNPESFLRAALYLRGEL